MKMIIHGLSINVFIFNAEGECESVDPDAPVALILHGGLTDNLSSYYATITSTLVELGMNVILYDRAGYGQSEYRPGCYNLKCIVRDIDSILDGAGVKKKIHVIGNSFGAGLATSYVALRPRRSASLILLEGQPLTPASRERFAAFLHKARRNIGDVVDHYERNSALSKKAVERMRVALMERTYLEDIEASDLPTLAQLHAISVPSLGIYGADSEHGGHEATLESLGHLENLRTEVIPHVSHFLLYEGLPTLKRLLREFYSRPGLLDGRS